MRYGFPMSSMKLCETSFVGERMPFEPVVDALRALRGIDVTSAIGLVVEIGDRSRFDHPRKLMGYLGLVAVAQGEDSPHKS